MTAKPRVVLIGGGGHGKVVLDALLESGRDVAGFIDDDPEKAGGQVLQFPILGPSSALRDLALRFHFEEVIVAIGDNYIRDRKFREVIAAGLKPVGVVHPGACVSRFAELGQGVVIMAGAVVNPGTVIDDNVCVNTCACVDHDNHLSRSCHVFPNATLAGGVQVGEFSYVGSGAVVNPYCPIGSHSYVGAGAVVIRAVPDGVVVAGVPAREIAKQLKRAL